MAKPEENKWVPWPEGEAGTEILNLEVDKTVDELFGLLYGGNKEFTVRPAPTRRHFCSGSVDRARRRPWPTYACPPPAAHCQPSAFLARTPCRLPTGTPAAMVRRSP
jgi:hypothetical protein